MWGGADILQLQDYCLIYRYSVIQQNVDRHRKFMSIPSFIVFHIIGYGICFAASIPAFFVIAEQEVSKIGIGNPSIDYRFCGIDSGIGIQSSVLYFCNFRYQAENRRLRFSIQTEK